MARRYDFSDQKKKPKRQRDGAFRGWVYRVKWQRRTRGAPGDGPPTLLRPKTKHFLTHGPALRFYRMFGPAPWRYFRTRMEATDRWPCTKGCGGLGYIVVGDKSTDRVDCSHCFGGTTVADYIYLRRLELPEIVFVRLERRPVGAWEDTEEEWQEQVSPAESLVPVAKKSAARFLQMALKGEELPPDEPPGKLDTSRIQGVLKEAYKDFTLPPPVALPLSAEEQERLESLQRDEYELEERKRWEEEQYRLSEQEDWIGPNF